MAHEVFRPGRVPDAGREWWKLSIELGERASQVMLLENLPGEKLVAGAIIRSDAK